MSRVFNGDWWSVRLPHGWKAKREQHGFTFFREPRIGTLQLSAARSDFGDVSEQDIQGFSSKSISLGSKISECEYDAFAGITAVRIAEGFEWNEWWLRHGPLLVYVTYVYPVGRVATDEKQDVIRILRSLASRD